MRFAVTSIYHTGRPPEITIRPAEPGEWHSVKNMMNGSAVVAVFETERQARKYADCMRECYRRAREGKGNEQF